MNTAILDSRFNKAASICNVFKKETPTQVFPAYIANILRLSVLKNICKQFLLDCFNFYIGLNVQRILILSWHLWSRTKLTFDESIKL